MERLISTRKECPEFGWGELSFVETGHPKVLAHLCKRRGSYALAVHNLGAEEVTVTLEFGDDPTHLLDLWGDEMYEPYDPQARTLRLTPYGYRWLRTTAFQPHGVRERDGEDKGIERKIEMSMEGDTTVLRRIVWPPILAREGRSLLQRTLWCSL